MKKPEKGTPAMGIAVGIGLVAVAVLVMVIGFWKTLILLILFGIGYFIGTVDNKQEFIKETANRIIPAKEAKVIDIKSEITRDQEERQSESGDSATENDTADNEEDGE